MLAMISGSGLAFRNVLFKEASNKIDAPMAALLLSLSMSMVAIAYFVFQRVSEGKPFISDVNTGGVFLAVLAGFSLAGANIFLAMSYKAGGMASLVSLLQNGIALSLTILIGVLFLNEGIKTVQVFGILTMALGIFLISKG